MKSSMPIAMGFFEVILGLFVGSWWSLMLISIDELTHTFKRLDHVLKIVGSVVNIFGGTYNEL